MLNAATLIAGAAVLALVAAAAYVAYRSFKRGGCPGCPHSKDAGCGQCQKDK